MRALADAIDILALLAAITAIAISLACTADLVNGDQARFDADATIGMIALGLALILDTISSRLDERGGA